ncbi:MAG: replication factor C large subunit [Desulfurococcales archaeon]|nr:replication factor C large subunit [Desulfurococcales archaeon]
MIAHGRAKPNIPWIIKYRPRTVDEVVNQDNAKKKLLAWFKQWVSGKPPAKRAVLLYGPPGVGKTSLVEAIARQFKFELLELNASDYRSATAIRRTVGVAANKKPLYGRGIIILLDEIDGIAPREDSGGLKALLEIIPHTTNPIVMTANDPWKEQLRPLHQQAELIQFKPLSVTQVMAVLQRICDLEGLECEREALRYIAEIEKGDVRAAINDLQAIAEGYGRVTLGIVKLVIRGRDKKSDIFVTLNQIFYSNKFWRSRMALSNSEEDYETVIAWLNDNIPRKYEDPRDAYRAFDALARATIMLNRAKFKTAWSLLTYVFSLAGPGVTFARKYSPISKARYAYPDRIKMMARLREVREIRESLASRLSERVLVSRRLVKTEILPFLFIIFRESEDPVPAARLALGYGLDRREVEFLAGHRSGEILSAIEKIKRSRRDLVEKRESKAEKREEPEEGAGKRRTRARRGRRPASSTLDSFFS